jgi:formate hydrogenlyase subunit 4
MLSFLLILIVSLFFNGVIGRTKSIFSGRKGPGILQPIKNVVLLLRKGSVFSNSSSIIFQIAPTIAFSAVLSAALLIPFSWRGSILSAQFDFILFVYLLGIGRFFMILGALDTGSSFEGMGANRESFYAMLLEPALLIILASFCIITGNYSFDTIFYTMGQYHVEYVLAALLGIFVLVNVALIENSRLPVDDPKTHLELTMVHEVMILDNSGFDLALIHLTGFLKFAIYGTMIANCLIPAQWSLALQIVLYFIVQVSFAITIGFVESFRARNRLNKNAQYILAVSAVAFIAFIFALVVNINTIR